jgi:O-antigen ligase
LKTFSKINVFFSTLNFVLCFIGYQFTTTLFLPVSSDIEGISQTVTIPYRAFALCLSIFVIFINIRKYIRKFEFPLIVFLFYWFILILRILYDNFFRTDVYLINTSQLWLYIFGICIPSVISIILGYDYIDLKKALNWICILVFLTLFLNLFAKQNLFVSSSQINSRQDANVGLQTLGFGNLGTTGIILTVFLLLRKRLSNIQTIIVLGILMISIFAMIRAGSRSPIVVLILVLFTWLISTGRRIGLRLTIFVIISLILVLNINFILHVLGNISPVTEQRLKMSIYEGDSSGRDLLFYNALTSFLESPILGKQFAFFYLGSFEYSHNIILDGFMGMGIFGGMAIIYFLFAALKKSFNFLKINDANSWIFLILLQQIFFEQFSGAFYYNQLLSVLVTFTFIYGKEGNAIDNSICAEY